MSDQINSKDFIIGTLVGGIVGATVALLFAPKSGRDLRADLNEGATQVKEKASAWKDIAQEKGSEWKEVDQEKGSDWYEKGTELTKQAIDRSEERRVGKECRSWWGW